MGINDLIPLLKPIQKPISLDKYRGKVVGVDGYIWLYKAVFSCAYEMGLGYRSPKFDSYLSKLLDMFDHFGVSPYFVFDGSDLPAKKCTNNKRDETRWDNIHKAKKFHEEGNRTEAENYFRKCIIISQEVAMGFIYILRERKVKYMVAPFEADAQLAYLAKTNQVDAVISEDSDLLVYECPTVIYKLNLQGEGIEINYKDIPTVPILGKQYSDPKKFRHLCILAGCDYLPNIRGIGLKKAIRYLKDSKTYLNAINGIRLSEKFEVPHNYEKEFYRADLTFQYQRVFDPRTNEMVHVNEPPLGFPVDKLAFLGPRIDGTPIVNAVITGVMRPDNLAVIHKIIRPEMPNVPIPPFIAQIKPRPEPIIINNTNSNEKVQQNGSIKGPLDENNNNTIINGSLNKQQSSSKANISVHPVIQSSPEKRKQEQEHAKRINNSIVKKAKESITSGVPISGLEYKSVKDIPPRVMSQVALRQRVAEAEKLREEQDRQRAIQINIRRKELLAMSNEGKKITSNDIQPNGNNKKIIQNMVMAPLVGENSSALSSNKVQPNGTYISDLPSHLVRVPPMDVKTVLSSNNKEVISQIIANSVPRIRVEDLPATTNSKTSTTNKQQSNGIDLSIISQNKPRAILATADLNIAPNKQQLRDDPQNVTPSKKKVVTITNENLNILLQPATKEQIREANARFYGREIKRNYSTATESRDESIDNNEEEKAKDNPGENKEEEITPTRWKRVRVDRWI